MTKTLLFLSTIGLVFSLHAQTDLPYQSDWSSTDDQNEWEQYQLGATGFFNWNFNSLGGLSHDYPVGNDNADFVSDWMVSPAINFYSTSKLSLSINTFTFIELTDIDYFGIWFSSGSKDPADNEYVEIVDLTTFSPGGVWADSMDIEIPYTASAGHIAFVYEATNNWFTVGLQDLVITPDSPQSNDDLVTNKTIQIYPTVSEAAFTFDLSDETLIGTYDLLIFNNVGQIIQQQPLQATNQSVRLEQPSGVYFYQISKAGKAVKTGRLMLIGEY